MADLSDKEAAQTVKVTGSDPAGIETNFLSVDLNGVLTTKNYAPQTFVSLSLNLTLANGLHMWSLANVTGSNVIIKIKEIKIINTRIAGTTGVAVDFRGLRFTSKTGGTTVPIETFDTTNSLNVNVTVASGATITGLATVPMVRALYSSDEWGPGGLDAEAYDHTLQTLLPIYKALTGSQEITVRPGQGFTIQNTTNTTSGTFDVHVIFTQESV